MSDTFSLALSAITTMPNARRLTSVHNLSTNSTNIARDVNVQRSRFVRGFWDELKEVLLDNLEDGVVGYLVEAEATRDTAVLHEKDIVDHYVLHRLINNILKANG